jgi:hypothetical protein
MGKDKVECSMVPTAAARMPIVAMVAVHDLHFGHPYCFATTRGGCSGTVVRTVCRVGRREQVGWRCGGVGHERRRCGGGRVTCSTLKDSGFFEL